MRLPEKIKNKKSAPGSCGMMVLWVWSDLWRKVVAYQPLDSHKWIVKMAADKEGEGSQEALLELPEPRLLVQGARPPVRRRLWKIQDAVRCRWIDSPPLLTSFLLSVVLSPRSSVHRVHHAPGQPHRGQHHPLLVPARPAQRSHPGLWASVLWEGSSCSSLSRFYNKTATFGLELHRQDLNPQNKTPKWKLYP